MKKSTPRYLDRNLFKEQNSCDTCIIQDGYFNLSGYIKSLLCDIDCGGCNECSYYYIRANKFLDKPNKLFGKSNFDLKALIACIAIEQCGLDTSILPLSKYNEYCVCKDCCSKDIWIDCKDLIKINKGKCKECEKDYLSLCGLIKNHYNSLIKK